MIDLINAIIFPDWLDPVAFKIWKISVRWYGLAYIAGLYAAFFYAVSLVKKRDIWIADGATRRPELIPTKLMLSDLMMYCLIGIIFGGRLGYILLYSPSMIVNAPLDVFKVWQGGMAFHGGFLGVCAAVIFAHWRKKLGLARIADMAAVGAPLGLFAVRFFGNFISQELYGRVTDVPWAFIFSVDSQPRHPSQLYEAFLEGIVIFLVLRILCLKFKALTKPGLCAGMFVLLYGVFRFSVEFFREPDQAIEQFGLLTRGMTYSLPMIFVGLAVVLWASRRSPVSPRRVNPEQVSDEPA